MALTIKSSDTAVAANAVIALQEHIEMGNKVSENIRNNIELFNQAADSFDKSFKEKIELIEQGSTELISATKEARNNFQNTLKSADKTISKINSSFSSLMKKIVYALIAFVFIEAIFFFGYLFYDSHKTNETKSALQSRLDKALYNVSNLKGFIIHIYNQDSQKASEDFTKWLNTNGDSNVQ
ncbi:hypothetical protein B9N64_00995 [Campylobacter concisus]|uniref:hypothetical protein n=1 Tax=Campylobacter concisus TaxID=199 RepID=UPI000B3D7917|nr:hypothetical protein [Campylobacter concisus]OUT15924.1 hypothetical protein B9N64_00995 [Campylobacter concisus]